jgi:hypothetical protein
MIGVNGVKSISVVAEKITKQNSLNGITPYRISQKISVNSVVKNNSSTSPLAYPVSWVKQKVTVTLKVTVT